MLKTAPIVALVGSVLGAGTLAVAFALTPSSGAPHGAATSESSAAPPAPVVPESIRHASSPRPAAAVRDAGSGPVRGAPSPARSDRARRLDDEDQSARKATILFETGEGRGGAAEEPARPPAEVSRPEPSGGSAQAGADPNMQDRKNAFLDSVGSTKTTNTLTTRLVPPASPYALEAGTIIPAVLLTAINSDLPGPVIGQVRENVYDTVSGNTLLVPQGARLLANYDSMVMWGQERVLLCWNRLLLPDGDSINLQCMPAADLQGAAGLTDSVDEHWFRILKGAAVASLLAVSTQALAGSPQNFNPTLPQVWAQNAAGSVNQVGQQLTARNLAIQPTITVRPGYSVNVIVTKDMTLAPYPTPSDVLGVRSEDAP